MKTILLSLMMIVLTGVAFGQSNRNRQQADVFIPRTLTAGTSMSARTAATTYDDTTQGFSVRGFSSVYVGIETAANDSATILLAYSISKDGVNFQTPILFDSLATTGQVGIGKYFQLPANVMGAEAVRIRAYGAAAGSSGYSANPSTTVTTKIIRKHY